MDRSEQPDVYQVYLGLDWAPVEAGGRVLIRPSRDAWNDFGFKTHADFRIIASTGEITAATGFLGFLLEEEAEATDTSHLRAFLSSAASTFVSAEDLPGRFFTMLREMDAYRRLVDALGVKELRQCLLSINDVVALTEYRSTTEWLNQALSSAVFNMSFIRSSESYFAFK